MDRVGRYLRRANKKTVIETELDNKGFEGRLEPLKNNEMAEASPSKFGGGRTIHASGTSEKGDENR